MSIINKMLKDLDHRQALATANQAPAPSVLRLLPAAREPGREWLWRIIAVLMLVALGWACWVAYQIWPRPIATDLAMRESFKTPAANIPHSASPSPSLANPEQNRVREANSNPGGMLRSAFATLRLAPEITTPIRPAAGSRVVPDLAGKNETSAPTIAGTPRANSLGLPAKDQVAERNAGAQVQREAPAAAMVQVKPADRRDASMAAGGEAGTVDKRERTRSPLERAEVSFRQAVTLLNQGRSTEAEELLVSALNIYPGHQAARQTHIAILIEQGRIDAARRELQVALAVDPGQAQFIAALARIHADRREYASALDVLSKASQDASASPEMLSLKAGVLQRMGRHTEAIEAYDRSLRAAPDVPSTLLGYAISLDALGRMGDAVQVYKRVLAAKPLSNEVRDYAEKRLRMTN